MSFANVMILWSGNMFTWVKRGSVCVLYDELVMMPIDFLQFEYIFNVEVTSWLIRVNKEGGREQVNGNIIIIIILYLPLHNRLQGDMARGCNC